METKWRSVYSGEIRIAIVVKHNGLVVSNHPQDPSYTIDFEPYYHDPEVERLVEMYSIGGSYEMPFSEANESTKSEQKSVVEGL